MIGNSPLKILPSFLFGLSLALKDAPITNKYMIYSSDLLHTLLIASITHAAAKLVVGIFNLWSKKGILDNLFKSLFKMADFMYLRKLLKL